VVTFGEYFSSPKNFLTAAEDMVRHFAEGLVGDGGGAIAYLDQYVGVDQAWQVITYGA
jgi:hypothetical protein